MLISRELSGSGKQRQGREVSDETRCRHDAGGFGAGGDCAGTRVLLCEYIFLCPMDYQEQYYLLVLS